MLDIGRKITLRSPSMVDSDLGLQDVPAAAGKRKILTETPE